MDQLDRLWTFYVVAREKGITKGAKKLYLTQSAVSQAFKQLEESYSLTLAERSRRGFSLTDAGRILFSSCEKIFAEYQNIDEVLKGWGKEPQGELKIGCDVTMAEGFFLGHLKKLKKRFPKLNIHLDVTWFTQPLLPYLKEGKVDLICVNEIFLSENASLFHVPLNVNAEVYLYGSKSYLKNFCLKKVEDIFQLRFIDLSDEHLFSTYFLRSVNLGGRWFRDYFYLNGSYKEAVLQDLGISIAPYFYIEKELKQKKIELLFPKKLKILRKDHLCCVKKNKDYPKYAALLDYFSKI